MRARLTVAVTGVLGLALALVVAVRGRSHERPRDAWSRAQEPLHREPDPYVEPWPALAEPVETELDEPDIRSIDSSPNVPIPGYVPMGLPPDFRERIVRDFIEHVETRLGPKGLREEQREAIARAQREFWDEHGPNVDAFVQGDITRLELADRTRAAMIHLADRMADSLSDAEYLALFDARKGEDLYSALFHSADEQPGLPMKPIEADVPNLALTARAAPPQPPPGAERIPGLHAPVPKGPAP